jgi:hypothetical protein
VAKELDLAGYKAFSPDLKAAAPTGREPMQRVSPAAALYLARLLNCRFPTAAEWQAAVAAAGPQAIKGANLRDRTWRKQLDYVVALQEKGLARAWPDAGIFWPKAHASALTGKAAVPCTDLDDGILLFAPVSPVADEAPLTFQHLVGNVAEFIFDDPAALADAFKNTPEPTVKAVAEFLDKQAASLGVIGGSALSAPELWDGKPAPAGRPFDLVCPADLTARAGSAVDVGFRLAFTAPTEPPAVRLKRVLDAQPYLTAGSP